MIGTGELLLIFLMILLLFGGKKLPELARSLGLGLREFKKAAQGLEEEPIAEAAAKQETVLESVHLEVLSEKEGAEK
jgi:sec-independent protein translocase protein TatA